MELGEVIDKVDELSKYDIFSCCNDFFRLIHIAIFFILFSHLNELNWFIVWSLSYWRGKRNNVLIKEQIILETSMTTTKQFLENIEKFIETHENSDVFINQKQVIVNFNLSKL